MTEEGHEETGQKGTRWRRWAVSLLILGLTCKLAEVGFRIINADTGPEPYKDTAVIEHLKPTLIPFRIHRGQVLHLRVAVVSGDPVDVMIGRGMEEKDGQFVTLSAGLEDRKGVRDFALDAKWPHDKGALLIVSTEGRSEVAIEAHASEE